MWHLRWGNMMGLRVGHIRLGQLPRTRKWRDVVELVAVGADVSQVADATIRAAGPAVHGTMDMFG